ncbi:MarR family winged helix-turn-helix transcriptional regulator [Pelagibacterium sp.]|uniref:MarR family winged helix-turn-helix transcriptional regulator n=1 Tax=Pelagibacterium sp. TaxID=1967288 RepID=UPI003A8E92E6
MGPSSWRRTNIGRLMNEAVRVFEQRVLELMRERGFSDLGAAHVNLTRHLDEDGSRLTELAERAAMTKQSMRELVEQVERAGLVQRKPDPNDGRAKIIVFTPAGLKWLAAFGESVATAEEEMADVIGSERLKQARDAMRQYVAGR